LTTTYFWELLELINDSLSPRVGELFLTTSNNFYSSDMLIGEIRSKSLAAALVSSSSEILLLGGSV
jgi:hypothetical protein